MDSFELVHEILKFVEAHLTEPLNVSMVCGKSGFSPWYFQRVFRSIAGISIGDYIRLRRLSLACQQLDRRQSKIIDVALGVGFESHEVFTRVFRMVYGMSPSQYQKDKPTTGVHFAPMSMNDIRQMQTSSSAAVSRLQLGHRTFATRCVEDQSILSRSPLQASAIPELWRSFMAANHGELSLAESTFVGICENVATQDCTLGTFDSIRYHVGLQVHDGAHIPSSYRTLVLDNGNYAVFSQLGILDTLQPLYRYIYGHWLFQSEAKLRPCADLEVFRPANEPHVFLIEIFLPIL